MQPIKQIYSRFLPHGGQWPSMAAKVCSTGKMRRSNYSGDEILQHEKSELSVQPTEETFAGSLKAIVVPQVFQTAPIIQQSMRLVAIVFYHSSF